MLPIKKGNLLNSINAHPERLAISLGTIELYATLYVARSIYSPSNQTKKVVSVIPNRDCTITELGPWVAEGPQG